MLEHTLTHTFPAAFSLLPSKMRSPEAEAMLLAIGLQESRFLHRAQIGGPARGFWQFEAGGGVAGVLSHPATEGLARQVCSALLYRPAIAVVHDAIEDNDTLATCFARLLMWTHPDALPKRGEASVAWGQYIDCWRPGKPHPETWDRLYAQAWAALS